MRHGDGVGLDDLETAYREHGAAFERVARAITGDEGRGYDVVHDAFVRAVRSRASFRGEGPVVAWIWRIVVNEARRRTPALAAVEEVDVPSGGGDGADRAYVRACIAALPERQRLVLFLRYYADLDYAAIGSALHIQPGTVAATLNAAHKKLAYDLEEVREWEI
jgi:RNA polymerase sigma-70 factor (ECF subfamily)